MVKPFWEGGDPDESARNHDGGAAGLHTWEGEESLTMLPGVVEFRVADPQRFRLVARGRSVGSIAVHAVDVTPLHSRRTPALIAEYPWPSLVLGHAAQGRLGMRQDGRDHRYGPDEMFLVRVDDEFEFDVRERWIGETLAIAFEDLQEEGELLRRYPLAKIAAARPVASMVLSSIRAAARAVPLHRSVSAGILLEDSIVALVRAMIADANEELISPADERAVLRLRITRHLERRSTDPAVGPDYIAETFGISARTLRRLFEDEESVADRIRAFRTDALIRSLATTGRPFDDLSRSAGFGSPASARRALAERTGKTPEQMRRPSEQ